MWSKDKKAIAQPWQKLVKSVKIQSSKLALVSKLKITGIDFYYYFWECRNHFNHVMSICMISQFGQILTVILCIFGLEFKHAQDGLQTLNLALQLFGGLVCGILNLQVLLQGVNKVDSVLIYAHTMSTYTQH